MSVVEMQSMNVSVLPQQAPMNILWRGAGLGMAPLSWIRAGSKVTPSTYRVTEGNWMLSDRWCHSLSHTWWTERQQSEPEPDLSIKVKEWTFTLCVFRLSTKAPIQQCKNTLLNKSPAFIIIRILYNYKAIQMCWKYHVVIDSVVWRELLYTKLGRCRGSDGGIWQIFSVSDKLPLIHAASICLGPGASVKTNFTNQGAEIWHRRIWKFWVLWCITEKKKMWSNSWARCLTFHRCIINCISPISV